MKELKTRIYKIRFEGNNLLPSDLDYVVSMLNKWVKNPTKTDKYITYESSAVLSGIILARIATKIGRSIQAEPLDEHS